MCEAGEGKVYPPVKSIPDSKRLRIAVTGGAGFVGSHLVDRLMMAGHQVTGNETFNHSYYLISLLCLFQSSIICSLVEQRI